MPKLKLTKTVVRAAHAERAPFELGDTIIPGFLLKVTPAGRKIFMSSCPTRSRRQSREPRPLPPSSRCRRRRTRCRPGGAVASTGWGMGAQAGHPQKRLRHGAASSIPPRARFRRAADRACRDGTSRPRTHSAGQTRSRSADRPGRGRRREAPAARARARERCAGSSGAVLRCRDAGARRTASRPARSRRCGRHTSPPPDARSAR